jgi:hypothetical protein
MMRSILLTVLALGAQAAWAQDATDPTSSEVLVEETSVTVEQMTDTGDGTVVIDDTEVVEDDDGDEVVRDEVVVEEPSETVEDETGIIEDAAEVSDGDEAVRTDSRSARGAFRGGHHGQVSTLARAGLGPVFGKLRSQGYGDISVEQAGTEISISAARAGETRELVYDASTGALLSDVAGPTSTGILQRLSSKPRKQSTVGSKHERKSSNAANGGRKDRGNGVDGKSGKSGKGGSNGKSNGNGKGGGNGNGNGGGKGNGKNR